MKSKNKTNHLQEETDKIEQIPGEMNNGREGQDEPIKAKKSRKNRFLARLRKTWARIAGFMRSCCTCIQVERSAEELAEPSVITMEELQGPNEINMEEEVLDINLVELPCSKRISMDEELQDSSNINMEEDLPKSSGIIVEDSKDPLYTSADTLAVKKENVEQNENIEEAEAVVTDSFVEEEMEEEYRFFHVVHSQEDLYVQYYASQLIQEILAEYHIEDQIQTTENLYIQDYDAKDEEQQDEEELECKNVEDDAELKIKEDGEEGLEKESQRASCEMPEPSHISNSDPLYTSADTLAIKKESVEQNENIETDNEEAEVGMTDSFVEEEIEEEYHFLHVVHSQEDLYVQYYASQLIQEILAEYHFDDQIQTTENLYIQDYDAKDEEQQDGEELECKNVEDDAELKIKEDGEEGLEKESQRASCEMPEPSHISNSDSFYTSADTLAAKKENVEPNQTIKTDNEEAEVAVTDSFEKQKALCEMQEPSPEYHIYDQIQKTENLHIQDYNEKDEEQQDGEKLEYKIAEDNAELNKQTINQTDNESSRGKESETNKGEDNSINFNEEREECKYKQMSSCQSSSLEEETPEELYKSIKTSQSDSRPGEEPSTSDICLEKRKQPGEKMPSTVPLTLQSFTFHRKLGEGCFAEVFLASDIIRKECVAIKALSKYTFEKDGESFAERNILKLSHESPFLIHGLAAFHTEKVVYYVLELATSGDLFHFMINRLPVDPPIIQFIIAEVICGTQFLHKKNIIHRDLKPENILVTADGHMKITDFGLALMDVYEKTKEQPRGTPYYMAPELVKNQEYGRAVDYFAIGVILYYLSACQYPFDDDDDDDATEVMHLILHHTPIYPEFLTPDTVDILQGLLCKDQDNRLGVIGDIRNHQFFSNINWEDIEARRVEPPEIMRADFVDWNMDQTMRYEEIKIKIRPKYQEIFKEFSFVSPDWSQHYHPVNNEAIQ